MRRKRCARDASNRHARSQRPHANRSTLVKYTARTVQTGMAPTDGTIKAATTHNRLTRLLHSCGFGGLTTISFSAALPGLPSHHQLPATTLRGLLLYARLLVSRNSFGCRYYFSPSPPPVLGPLPRSTGAGAIASFQACENGTQHTNELRDVFFVRAHRFTEPTTCATCVLH